MSRLIVLVLAGALFPGTGCDPSGSVTLGGADPSVGGKIDSTVGPMPGDAGQVALPATTAPKLLLSGSALYPRVIKLAHGAQAGTIVASVARFLPSGRMGGTILHSTDNGFSFAEVGRIDDPVTNTGLCCSTLYELPQAVGGLAAGTLIWSASVGLDPPAQPMQIIAWSSVNAGKTWTRLATVVTAGVPRSKGGLWEPEFSVLPDGALACHYSDETDAAHSQKLVEVRSTNGVAWGAPVNTVALTPHGRRPGMPVVRRLPSGTYVMSYELCGVPVAGDDCTAYLRFSSDGWNWGNPREAGLKATTLDGKHFAHAPTLTWSDAPGQNGRLYLIGQLVFDGANRLAPDSGRTVLANTDSGNRSWYELPAPIPIPEAFNNFCPNYSSSILPLDGGQIGLEVATRWDGDVCRAYFARGRLSGTGDSQGVKNGGRYRLVNLLSGLCLDVSGGSTDAGTRIQQWTCNGLAPQNWTFTATSGGSFSLRAENSGQCLATVGGASNAGDATEQRPCDGGGAQAWTLRNVGSGYYVLGRPGASVCLDDAAASLTAGTPIQLWTCNDLSPQIWRLEER